MDTKRFIRKNSFVVIIIFSMILLTPFNIFAEELEDGSSVNLNENVLLDNSNEIVSDNNSISEDTVIEEIKTEESSSDFLKSKDVIGNKKEKELNNNEEIKTENHKVLCITTKVDENGNPLRGAILQIIDKDGNIVDEWVSDGSGHETMLFEGKYILHEKRAPDGYTLAADKTFVVKVEVNNVNAGVDFSEEPCNHYGGTPLYYVESEGEKQEVYCINQDWETPDDNSIYDGKVIDSSNINSFMIQTVYIDAHQNKDSIDISDQSMTSKELYNKILDIIYHRQRASSIFNDLTEAEIRYVTESALKNYTNAGLTRVQRVSISQVPIGYDNFDYYITSDEKYIWYLYPWYRSFIYDPESLDLFRTDIGNGDAFGTLARHWSIAHNAKNDAKVRAKLARYYDLYKYLVSDREHHPTDMHLYIFYTNNKSIDLSGYDFDEGRYQNLLGIHWFNPYDKNNKIYLTNVNHSFSKQDKEKITKEKEKRSNASRQNVINSPQTGDNIDNYVTMALTSFVLSGVGIGKLIRKN